jgi:mono/diheme cytochrome c family protein
MLLLIAAAILAACSDQQPASKKQPPVQVAPADPVLGKVLFDANCKACHGDEARGTSQGPPLVHKIYAPGHHGDFSFYRAVSSGSRSHHWNFGDMPPVAGVSPQQTSHIIAYIRQKQRQVGIQ